MRYVKGWNWGGAPSDPDVRVASSQLRKDSAGEAKKKKHHYISVTYMEGFCAADGRIWTYRSEAPTTPHPKRPPDVACTNYYYSQKREDGAYDHNSVENLWSAVETVWPETLRAVRARKLSLAISFNVLGMMSITAVRVPAARQRQELILAAKLRAQFVAAEKLGKLPPEYERYAGQLDTIPVGINPQQSLNSMGDDFRRYGELCFKLGFEILHNTTDLPFITSDNPVCIYDPRTPPGLRRPYEYDGEVELIFPLDAKTLLRGSNRLRPVNQVGAHRTLAHRDAVLKYNKTIAQFAYGLALASDRSSDSVIARHAPRGPTIEIDVSGPPQDIKIIWRHAFGPKPQLSPFIDTPEKIARFEAQVAAQASSGAGSGNKPSIRSASTRRRSR